MVDPTPATWVLAATPILALVGLVLHGRLGTVRSSFVAVSLAAVLAMTVFGTKPRGMFIALGKGVWTGTWILYVVWPALLMYHLARAGGLEEMGQTLSSLLSRRIDNVLLIAWVLPSFIQGVAGFGTPIAVAAPLLVSMGVSPVMAVALPLIGYHWSVTFGSMGSSFYMGGLTAHFDPMSMTRYANVASAALSVNAILAGFMVAAMYGGASAVRKSVRFVLPVGVAMAIALNVTARIEPAIASLATGAIGIVVAILVGRRINGEPMIARRLKALMAWPLALPHPSIRMEPYGPASNAKEQQSGELRRLCVISLPYAYLLLMVTAVFIHPAVRGWVKGHLLIAPSFPATTTALGFSTSPAESSTPIALLGHPGSYLLLAALFGYLTYMRTVWSDSERVPLAREYFKSALRSSPAILLLTILALTMVDSGMIRTLAEGISEAGTAFPALSPIIGALGAFMTGSTTNSNALFAALQRDVANLIGVAPEVLVAFQTTGGNIGNSVAPVVILIGASALSVRGLSDRIFRKVLLPAGIIMAGTILMSIAFSYVL